MKTIDIDEDVYKYLQKHAIAFVEEPNDTLRRLFTLDKNNDLINVTPYKRKKPRTNLKALKTAGIISENEELYFKDYRDNPFPDKKAIIKGEKLLYDGRILSMSQHAVNILRELGYRTQDVRGPQFWWTKGGKSIMQLWNEYLEHNYNIK